MERIIYNKTGHRTSRFSLQFFLKRISNRNTNQIQIMSHASLISRTRNSEIFIGGFDQLVPINEVMEVVLYGSYIVVVFKVLGSTRSIYMFVYTYIHILYICCLCYILKTHALKSLESKNVINRLNRWFIVLSSTIYNSFLHICINMMIIHRTYIHKQLYIEPLISLSFVLQFLTALRPLIKLSVIRISCSRPLI